MHITHTSLLYLYASIYIDKSYIIHDYNKHIPYTNMHLFMTNTLYTHTHYTIQYNIIPIYTHIYLPDN